MKNLEKKKVLVLSWKFDLKDVALYDGETIIRPFENGESKDAHTTVLRLIKKFNPEILLVDDIPSTLLKKVMDMGIEVMTCHRQSIIEGRARMRKLREIEIREQEQQEQRERIKKLQKRFKENQEDFSLYEPEDAQ